MQYRLNAKGELSWPGTVEDRDCSFSLAVLCSSPTLTAQAAGDEDTEYRVDWRIK